MFRIYWQWNNHRETHSDYETLKEARAAIQTKRANKNLMVAEIGDNYGADFIERWISLVDRNNTFVKES